MRSGISQQEAAAATKRILGFYDTIPAADPKAFAAGLTALLQTYPAAVVERAIDPVQGIAKQVQFLNLAAIGKHLDAWRDEYLARQRRLEGPKALADPPRDPEAEERIRKKFVALGATLRSMQ